MNNNTEKLTNVINILDFHGSNLVVVEHEGIDHVYAKRISDLVNLDWRTQKKQILSDDSTVLLGTKELMHPVFALGDELKPPTKGVYIRLDRVIAFLFRVNTGRMKANNNVEAAERLLELQVEWAEALHNYETKGFAIKQNHYLTRDQARKEEIHFIKLIKDRNQTTNKDEQNVINSLIRNLATELGYPMAEAKEV